MLTVKLFQWIHFEVESCVRAINVYFMWGSNVDRVKFDDYTGNLPIRQLKNLAKLPAIYIYIYIYIIYGISIASSR